MCKRMWPLLRLKADNDEALKEAYRQVYLEMYVRVEHYEWTGKRVHFHAATFEHAFSESSDYKNSYGEHDIPFSKRRARLMPWIKEVLKGEQGTIERLHQLRKDSRNRSVVRRSLIVIEEKYVVVLQARKDNDLDFVTAFPTDEKYLKKLRKDSSLIETRKMPQSSGD